VLRPVIEAYLQGRAMTGQDVATMRAYLRQWMASPAWAGEGIAELRTDIDKLTSRAAIKAWLNRALDFGIDPL